jgi:hypothetical protein
VGVFDVLARAVFLRADLVGFSPFQPLTRPPCAFLPHRRFEVLQRPFSRSLRGRRESSSHCVCGLGLPARATNLHREHRTCPFLMIL